MNEINYFVTTKEYFNQLPEAQGLNEVALIIESNSVQTQSFTQLPNKETELNETNLWTLHASSLVNQMPEFNSYPSMEEVEKDLFSTDIVFFSGYAPLGTYPINLTHAVSEEKEVVSYVVSVLRNNDKSATSVWNDDVVS
jgi:hypothetical protein